MTGPAGDAGFVMMDALVAVALLGLVGTGAVGLMTSLVAGQDRQLEHSQALLMAELLSRQYAEFGPGSSGGHSEDEQFAYDIETSGAVADGSRLVPMVVKVRQKGLGGGDILRLDFLAPVPPS